MLHAVLVQSRFSMLIPTSKKQEKNKKIHETCQENAGHRVYMVPLVITAIPI